jgi:hypothetical protein
VMIDPDHAELVYGPAGRELALAGGISDKLVHTLSCPGRYKEIVNEIRQHLLNHHTYANRLEELVAALVQ